MPRIKSFPPVSAPDSKLLILGSMPGEASLAVNEYYAHPRNQFWPIITDILKRDRILSYPEKTGLLKENQIALWDVLEACQRKGSLDSNIQDETPNDFITFFAGHPKIKTICFNGGKAQSSFKKWVMPALADNDAYKFVLLPSTSPANASYNFEQKRHLWNEAFKTK